MKLTKKLNVTLVLVVVCLVLSVWTSYAWLTISRNPEVQRVETNIGANGSLEIALLTQETYQDPTLIKTTVGDSAVKQDAQESNKSWGNVIQLEAGYGLDKIKLLPARLNVTSNEDGVYTVGSSILKTAEFGIDGRIKILSDDTVSTIWEDKDFTFYVDQQRYGVRAIGTISNLSSQQIALAGARTLTKTYTEAAHRTAENTWHTYGAGIVDIIYRHYALGHMYFTDSDTKLLQDFANGMLESMEYVDGALRQSMIGMAAAYVYDEPDFETLSEMISSTSNLMSCINKEYMGEQYYYMLHDVAEAVSADLNSAKSAVAGSLYAMTDRSWSSIESVLINLFDPQHIYLGNKVLADTDAFESLTKDNTLLVSTESGVMGRIAEYTGNYSAFANWKDNISMEAQTASAAEKGMMVQMQVALGSVKAAVGGWTRTNMDNLYGFAIDLAFRCNVPSQLQLQTWEALRVEGASEYPAMQGSGSYMQFTSDNMDEDQLINLMDVIRVGFLNDKGELMKVAKLNISNYSIGEEGEIYAPLRLYEYEVDEIGKIIVQGRSEDAAIMELPENAPVIMTVVVWLDGDHVDNSMVSAIDQQSMNGILNLQFSSDADLVPSNQLIDRK